MDRGNRISAGISGECLKSFISWKYLMLVLIFSFFSSKFTQAQDAAVQKTAFKIPAGQQVEYKKGSVVSASKTLTPAEVRSLMAANADALHSYNSGRVLIGVGDGFGGGVIVTCLASALIANKYDYGSQPRTPVYAVGLCFAIPFFITDIVLTSVGRGKIRSSVNTYNSGVSKPVSYKVDFGLQSSGVGFALKF